MNKSLLVAALVSHAQNSINKKEPEMTTLSKEQLRSSCIENENQFMDVLANRIAGNANPEEDSRLDVAYAIARHLKLDWPSSCTPIVASPVSGQDTNGDNWIKWNGGDCPIKPGEDFKVKLANGEERPGGVCFEWSWSHDDPSVVPIVEYCITSKPDYKAQRDALLELLEQAEKALESMVQYSQDSHDEPPFPASALDHEAYQLSCEIVSAIASVKGGAR